ncbi:MAG: acetoin dehydrogenase dihydrolipoyllysine-residue acetyltransferase subunit [Pseudomonadota bacterium]
MPTEVIMPKVDMDMATGTIAVWHVAEGARVEAGAPLFDIETDKAAMEVEAPASGVLRQTQAAGAEVPIGQAVGWIYAPGEADAALLAAGAPADRAGFSSRDGSAGPALDLPQTPPTQPTAMQGSAVGAATDAPSQTPARPRATPAARKAATKAGLALATITGSGPKGRIQRADVAAVAPNPLAEARVAQPPTSPPPQSMLSSSTSPDTAPISGDLPVRYSGAGGRTPFFLLHGFAADAGIWAALDPLLPPGHRRLKLELPGHSAAQVRASSPPMEGFAAMCGQVRAQFDALDVGHVHLVGHSLGGALALALADTRPRQIASLTLLCPAGLGPQINGPVIDGILRARRAESLAPWLRMLVADPETIGWGYVQAAAAARADPGLRAAQAAWAEALFPDGTQAFDLTAALDRLACPTRIIWGRQDQIIPWTHALRAPGRVALHFLDGVGHLPQIEAPEEIAGLLAQVS